MGEKTPMTARDVAARHSTGRGGVGLPPGRWSPGKDRCSVSNCSEIANRLTWIWRSVARRVAMMRRTVQKAAASMTANNTEIPVMITTSTMKSV